MKQSKAKIFRNPEEYEEVMQRQPYTDDVVLPDEIEPISKTNTLEEYHPKVE